MDAHVIEEGFQRMWKIFEETGRKFQKTEKMLKEQFQETDRKFREADKKFDKHFGKIKKLDRNCGKLLDALVKPSMGQQFRKRGIPVEGSDQRVEKQSRILSFAGDASACGIFCKRGLG